MLPPLFRGGEASEALASAGPLFTLAPPDAAPGPAVGVGAKAARWLRSCAARPLDRLLHVDRLNRTYARCAGAANAAQFLHRVLDDLQVRFRLPKDELAHIPRTGPLVVVANHPFGALDGLILASVLGAVRSDVKVMANHLLARISELRDLFIFVDPFGGGSATAANAMPTRRSLRWLKGGGVLAAFPAGEVAHLQWRDLARRSRDASGPPSRSAGAVDDPPWNDSIARIIRHAHAPVLPIYFEGTNSLTFHLLGLLHPLLRTAMLARELYAKEGECIELRIGSIIPPKRALACESDEALTDYLRGRTLLLRHTLRPAPPASSSSAPRTAGSTPLHRSAATPPTHISFLRRRSTQPAAGEPISPAVDPALLAGDMAALSEEAILVDNDDYTVYHARAPRLRNVLREIGRLREITFRATGEGTGKASDLDTFDYDYIHLFAWHKVRREIVGAYRLGPTDELLPAKGRLGLYTSTLFNYDARLLARITPALEMGRSFVRPEYQKSYAPLLLLWKGNGAYLVRHPRYRRLFGPVSISNNYQSASRRLMVQYLKQRHALPDGDNLVRPRHPFRLPRGAGAWEQALAAALLRDSDEISALIADLEPDHKGIPVLVKQYLKLGAKFLAFNVDPAFSDALDGLIVVDLCETEARVLEKYMTKPGYAAFISARPSPRRQPTPTPAAAS